MALDVNRVDATARSLGVSAAEMGRVHSIEYARVRFLHARAYGDFGNMVSVSHDRVGDMLAAQGNRTGALAAYRDSMMIRERLARQDPGNVQWQRDLLASTWKSGTTALALALADCATAVPQANRALALAEDLTLRDRSGSIRKADLAAARSLSGRVLEACLTKPTAAAP